MPACDVASTPGPQGARGGCGGGAKRGAGPDARGGRRGRRAWRAARRRGCRRCASATPSRPPRSSSSARASACASAPPGRGPTWSRCAAVPARPGAAEALGAPGSSCRCCRPRVRLRGPFVPDSARQAAPEAGRTCVPAGRGAGQHADGRCGGDAVPARRGRPRAGRRAAAAAGQGRLAAHGIPHRRAPARHPVLPRRGPAPDLGRRAGVPRRCPRRAAAPLCQEVALWKPLQRVVGFSVCL